MRMFLNGLCGSRREQLVRTSSTVGEINLRLQLTPAYRRGIFANPRVQELTKIYFLEKAKKRGILVAACDFGPDHFHAFLSNWKHYSVEKRANELKGFTSYMMRKHHWNLFRGHLWGGKFWSAKGNAVEFSFTEVLLVCCARIFKKGEHSVIAARKETRTNV